MNDQPMVLAGPVAEDAAPTLRQLDRAWVSGKTLQTSEGRFEVRGVTYGAFRPDEYGNEYWNHALVERDFALMAVNGINPVRIPHTTPPRSLLDSAKRYGLRVMVGLSAEQYVGYLIDRYRFDIEAVVRDRVSECRGHPALLCYALGNEIPASIVRWLGPRAVSRYLGRLCDVVRSLDPTALITYVNYPSTEYLDLPFLDVVSFNVYLSPCGWATASTAHRDWAGRSPKRCRYASAGCRLADSYRTGVRQRRSDRFLLD